MTLTALPPELLIVIFLHATTPRVYLDTGIPAQKNDHSSYRFDLRTRINLSEVCRGWNRVAIGLIYNEVYLWSFLQLLAFETTLEASTHRLGPLVTFLSIDALTPSFDWRVSTNVVAALHRICSICPNLKTLRFHPVPDQDKNSLTAFFEAFDSSPTLCLPSRLFSSNSHLQELSVSLVSLQFLSRDISIGISRTLKTLSIICTSPDYEFPLIEWPQLEKFRCIAALDLPRCPRTGEQDNPCGLHGLLMRLVEKWAMPSLEYLTLNSTFEFHFFRDCFPLLERYKDQLVYLNVYHINTKEEASDLTSALKMMPRLQHLVLEGTVSLSLDASHPELKRFDIWGDWIPTPIYEWGSINHTRNLGVIDDSTAFPLLKHVRFFDNALASTASGVDLPLIIPPTDDDSQIAAVERFQHAGVDIQVLGGSVVCRNDLYYVDNQLDASVIFQLYPPENLAEDNVDDHDGRISHLGSFKQWPLSDSDSDSDYSPESCPAYSDNGTASDDDSEYWEYRSDSSADDSLFDDIKETLLNTVTS